MKKLVAILTVMTMVLTTLVVPTVAFGTQETSKGEVILLNTNGPFSFAGLNNGEKNSQFNIKIPVGSKIGSVFTGKVEDPVHIEGYDFIGWIEVVAEYDDNGMPKDWVAKDSEATPITTAEMLEIVIDSGDTTISYKTIWQGKGNNGQIPGPPVNDDMMPDYSDLIAEYEPFCNNFFNSILDKDENGNIIYEEDEDGNKKYEITVNAVKPSPQSDGLALDIIFSPFNEKLTQSFEQSDLPYQVYLSCSQMAEGNFDEVTMELSLSVPRVDENGDPVLDGGGDQMRDNVTVMNKEVTVNYVYDDEMANQIAGYIGNMNLNGSQFYVRDMELINYWYNLSLTDISSMEYALINYSSALKEALGTYNFRLNVRMGQEPTYYSFEAGDSAIVYNGTFYGFTPRVDAIGEHIIHVAEGTTNQELANVAEERIERYLDGKVDVTITQKSETVSGAYERLAQAYRDSVDEQVKEMNAMLDELRQNKTTMVSQGASAEEIAGIDRMIAEMEESIRCTEESETNYLAEIEFLNVLAESYSNLPTFTLDINGLERDIIILADGELDDPTLITKDIATDVQISTESSEIPLDAMIEVNDADPEVDVEDVHQTYDIKINSKTLAKAVSNASKGYIIDANGYITAPKGSDGEEDLDNEELQDVFKVSVPLSDELYDEYEEKGFLIAYYVTKDGDTYEYEVDVVEDDSKNAKTKYRAEFYTNHFSTYTIAATSEGDDSEEGEGDSSGPVFFVISSNGGLLSYEFEDGTTEDRHAKMWVLGADSTLEDISGVGDMPSLTNVKKDNASLKGWELYTGDNFDYERYAPGTKVNLTEGAKSRIYTGTYYFEAENGYEAGTYDEYLVVTNKKQLTKEDGSLFTESDLMSFDVENIIYCAIAQWLEVAAPEEAEKTINTSNDEIKEVKDVLAQVEVAEDVSVKVADAAVEDAIEEAIKGKQTVTITTTPIAEPVEKEDAVVEFGKENVEKVEDTKAKNTDEIAQFLDLSVLMKVKVNGQVEAEGEVSELSKPITFTIDIPEYLLDIAKSFYIIRVHDGESDIITPDSVIDGKLSFKTDRFSTYALAYEPKAVNDDTQGGEGTTPGGQPGTNPGDTGNNTAQGGSTTTTPDKAVDTGDDFNMAPFIVAMAIALAGVAVAMFRRKTVK